MGNVGIDSGATYTRLWGGQGRVLKVNTPQTYKEYLQLLFTVLEEFQPIDVLVLALPALVEAQQIIKGANLGSDWNGKNIAEDIRNLMPITGEILIRQDVEVAGYAVQKQELSELEPTLIVTLSTGVGGVLVTRNLIWPLEIGHMVLNLSGNNVRCGCGQYGCVEADLSGTALQHSLGIRPENINDTFFWAGYGNLLGRVFLIVSALFKLKQIILTGGVSQKHPLFLEHTQRYLTENLKHVTQPIIRISHLGDNIGVYGAYWLANDFLKEVGNQGLK